MLFISKKIKFNSNKKLNILHLIFKNKNQKIEESADWKGTANKILGKRMNIKLTKNNEYFKNKSRVGEQNNNSLFIKKF